MPKGPRGERRPGDVVGAAIKVAKIATGEIDEGPACDDKDKDRAAAEMWRMGGKARASKISQRAAAARWKR